MKAAFYLGLAGIALFAVLKGYFLLPLPGAQQVDTLESVYFLYANRWYARACFIILMAFGIRAAFRTRRKWIPIASILVAASIVWYFNFRLTAESMFDEVEKLTLKPRAENRVGESGLVLGVVHRGVAKAYPLRFLAYHHQVRDTIAGKPIMVTYCLVCRTGRVFEPEINGKATKFRLVGMDRFNTVFEDAESGSWWRQATGVAVVGPLRGTRLIEVPSDQFTLRKWLELYPNSLIMQPDPEALRDYRPEGEFERDQSAEVPAGTAPAQWPDNAWVVGVESGGVAKAWDWSRLQRERIINDVVGGVPLVVALARDRHSVVVFERPAAAAAFTVRDDTLADGSNSYDFTGTDLGDRSRRLRRIEASQEFWHSWRNFHPGTLH